MADGFAFEDCLLKHYIRKEVWLPFCRDRLRKIRAATPKNPRRLRYFTFCAVGALDVLLLDREKVIRKSTTDEFDTVFFFDKSEEAIVEIRIGPRVARSSRDQDQDASRFSAKRERDGAMNSRLSVETRPSTQSEVRTPGGAT